MSASVNGGNGFRYSEALVSKQMALSREDSQLIRNDRLKQDLHWQKKGREIALSLAGVKALWRSTVNAPLTLDLSACLLPSLAKNGAPGEPLALPEPITFARPAKLKVRRIFVNRRVLLATDEAGQDWHVIVGNNTLFVRGMVVPAAPDPGNPGYYRLAGKLPRSRNRWI